MTTDIMRRAPSIQKVKIILREIISHGDQAEIGDILGCTRNDISNRFNPDNARKPGLVEGLRESWAICVVNPDAGRKLRAYIDGLFDSWLDPVKTTDKNLSVLVSDASQELTDLIRARSEGRPFQEQKEEALALRAVADQIIEALDNQFELRPNGVLKAVSK